MRPFEEIQMSQEELHQVSFLPVWIFYSICRRGGAPQSVQPMQLIHLIEGHFSPPEDPCAWIADFLKINLHKLFIKHFGSIESPDFRNLDSQLSAALDLLLLKALTNKPMEALRLELSLYCAAVGECQFAEVPKDHEGRKRMRRQAQVIQGMLA